MNQSMYFPAFHQVRFRRNESYRNSLWLGLTWFILSLPEIILCNVLLPLASFSWDWPWRLVIRLWTTVKLAFKLLFYGVMGYVSTENVTLDEMKRRLFVVQLHKAMQGKLDE